MQRNEILNELIKLMEENPKMRVVPMVDYEVCGGDDFCSWAGSLQSVGIDKTLNGNSEHRYEDAIQLNEERIYFYSDDSDSIADLFFDEGFKDDEVDRMVDDLPWDDVIVLIISTP